MMSHSPAGAIPTKVPDALHPDPALPTSFRRRAPPGEPVTAWLRRGRQLLAEGKPAEAAALFRALVARLPHHGEARIMLAHALKLAGEFTAAAEVLTSLRADYPGDPAVTRELGRLHAAQSLVDDAAGWFRETLRLDPGDADAEHWLANLAHQRGDPVAAQAHFRRAVALRPLLCVPAAQDPPAFSALLLFAPGGANTPPDTLVRAAAYECRFLLLVADAAYDAEALRGRAQVVVNLVADADVSGDILPLAERLVTALGLPVINHPALIARTDRASVAALLARLPGCRVPAVRRLAPGAGTPAALAYPALLRVAGRHGGQDFERIDNPAAFAAFVKQHPAVPLYLSEYIDYASSDGFFRKYRFFCIDEQVLPYHLAIHRQWKVHRETTDMAEHPWMQAEETRFLTQPQAVFGPPQLATLHAIRRRVSLDVCGIDCALDREGRLVVFEVNAAMLMHAPGAGEPARALAAARIRQAFDALLEGRAVPPAGR